MRRRSLVLVLVVAAVLLALGLSLGGDDGSPLSRLVDAVHGSRGGH